MIQSVLFVALRG